MSSESPYHGFRIPGGSLHLESDDELNADADITQDEDVFYTFWEPALQSISHFTPEGLSDVVCRIPHPSASRTGEYVRALNLSGIAFRQLDPLSLQRLANHDSLMTEYLLRVQANIFPYTLPLASADSEVPSTSSNAESPVSDDSELGPQSTVTSPSSPVDNSPPIVDSAESPPIATECGDEYSNSNPEPLSDQAQHPPLQDTVDVDDQENAAVFSRQETDNRDDQNSRSTGNHDTGESERQSSSDRDSRHTSHPPSESDTVDPPDGEAHIESELSKDVSVNGASVQAATNPLPRDMADTADENDVSPLAETKPPSPPTCDTTSSLDSSPDECASHTTVKASASPSASDSDKLAGSPSQLAAAAPMQQGAVAPGDSAQCSTPPNPTLPSTPPPDQGNGSPFLGCSLLQFSPFSMTTRLDDDTSACPTELFKGSTNLSDFFLHLTHEGSSEQLSEEDSETATQTEPLEGFSPIPPSPPAPRAEATDAGETSCLRVSDKNNNIRLEDGPLPASHGVQEAETEYVHGPVNQVGSSTEPGTDPQLGKGSLDSQSADSAENGAVEEGSDSRDDVSSSPTVTVTVIGSPPRLRACDFELACGKNADTSLDPTDPTVEVGANAGPTVSNCNEVQPQSHERAPLQSRDREPRFGDATATADGGEHYDYSLQLPHRNPLRPSLLRLTIPISPSSLEEELTQVSSLFSPISRATETPASEVTECSQSSQFDRLLLNSQSSFAEDKPVIKLRRGARVQRPSAPCQQSRGTDTADLAIEFEAPVERVLVDAGMQTEDDMEAHNLRRRIKALERELRSLRANMRRAEDHVREETKPKSFWRQVATTDRVVPAPAPVKLNSLKTLSRKLSSPQQGRIGSSRSF